MNTEHNVPKCNLNAVITDLVDDLKSYKASANPLSFIVKRKEKAINDLKDVKVEIDFLQSNSMMTSVFKEIERLTKEDENIERIQVNIDVKPFTNKQASVNVKYYAAT